jgi:hypothetical protein
VRAVAAPFARDSAPVRLGRTHRFSGIARGVEVDVGIEGVDRHACAARGSGSSLPVTVAGGSLTARLTTSTLGQDFVTFLLVCRSAALDLVVSGLPAVDSAQVSIVAVIDTLLPWVRNGTQSVAALPDPTTSIAPQPVVGSDGRTYRAPAQTIASASRGTTTVTVQYAAVPAGCPVDQPLAWYRLDGDATDASGNSAHGTVRGPIAAADRAGTAGAALSFDGDDVVELGDRFNTLTLPFSLAAWVFQPAASQGEFRAILATDDELDRYAGLWFMTAPGGRLSVTYADGGAVGATTRRTAESIAPLPTDAWVHVVATVRGPTDMSLYVNGAPVATTLSGTGGPIVHTVAPARIGAFQLIAANRPWLGRLDEVRLYDCSLDASEVAALFARP